MPSSGRRTPTAAELAAALLPDEERTLLLRACLPTARDAFAALESPLELLRDPEVKRAALMPSLLRAAPSDADPSLLSVLRAARAHEELRVAATSDAIREVLGGLREPALVVGGVAAAATAYEEWPLRHCHDLDLRVRRRPGRATHASGFPVVRHVRLYPRGDVAGVWTRAVDARVAGVPARTLCPADAFAHVVGRAAWRVTTLRWALDAWWIVRRSPDLDWEVVAHHAAEARLARPVALMARWLRDELSVPVPDTALVALDEGARRADGRDAARVLRGAPRPWTVRRVVFGARYFARRALRRV